ncbi:MAG: cupin domain-containing protein [Pseudomonadota bacterium]
MSQYILKSRDIESLPEAKNIHQFNDRAIRNTKSLGDLVGLTSVGFHLVRVEPGDETTQHHNHEFSDEFIYVLSGNGALSIGEETIEIEVGDFAGFPMNGPAHSMTNTGEEDLVYLMGGGRPDIDICNYPKIDRRMYIVKGQKEYVDLRDLGYVTK